MARAPERRNWLRASRIASAALGGYVFPKFGLATHYHTQAIWPRWGKSLVMTTTVAAHIFHRSEERGVGKQFVRTCSSRWSPFQLKRKRCNWQINICTQNYKSSDI